MRRPLRLVMLWILLLLGHRVWAGNVTFQVDMNAAGPLDTTGVHIVGSINNWNPAANPMDSVAPGRFAVTLSLTAGETVTFKFLNGNAWGQEEGVFGECGFNTYRFLRVPATDTVLPWVCFGACDSTCAQAVGTRIACVGNSITWGWDLPDKVTQSFPSILQDSFGAGFVVENFGAPGAAVIRNAGNPYHRTEMFRHLLPFAPQETLIGLGINDSKSAIWGNWAANFPADYDSLLLALDSLPSVSRLWLMLPTTNFAPLFGIDSLVVAQQIVPHICAAARDGQYDLIDLHGYTAGFAAHFPDGLHPDTTATRAIATEIWRVMHLPRPTIAVVGNLPAVAVGWAWQWYLDGDTVPQAWGGQAQALTHAPTGTYRVSVQVDSVYKHLLLSDTVHVVAVAAEPSRAVEGRLFPNPVSDRLRWEVPAMVGQHAEVRIWDLAGKLALQAESETGGGRIDATHLPQGWYVLEARAEGAVWRAIFQK